MTQNIPCKGEFVIILEAAPDNLNADKEEAKMRLLFEHIASSMSHRAAVKLALELSDLPRNKLYDIASDYY